MWVLRTAAGSVLPTHLQLVFIGNCVALAFFVGLFLKGALSQKLNVWKYANVLFAALFLGLEVWWVASALAVPVQINGPAITLSVLLFAAGGYGFGSVLSWSRAVMHAQSRRHGQR